LRRRLRNAFFFNDWPWSHEAEAWWELLTISNEARGDDYPNVNLWGYICGINILSILAPPPTPSTSATMQPSLQRLALVSRSWELLTIPNESSDDDYPNVNFWVFLCGINILSIFCATAIHVGNKPFLQRLALVSRSRGVMGTVDNTK
jgi:hypothetical protein